MVVAALKTLLLLKQYTKWTNEYSFLCWAVSQKLGIFPVSLYSMFCFKPCGGVCVCPHLGCLYTKQTATLQPRRVGGKKTHACWWVVASWSTRIMSLKAQCFLTGHISFWSIGFAPLTPSFEEHFQKVWNECRLCGKYLSSVLTQLE